MTPRRVRKVARVGRFWFEVSWGVQRAKSPLGRGEFLKEPRTLPVLILRFCFELVCGVGAEQSARGGDGRKRQLIGRETPAGRITSPRRTPPCSVLDKPRAFTKVNSAARKTPKYEVWPRLERVREASRCVA